MEAIMCYMQNPISKEIWVVDLKMARRLARYQWVRVKRVADKWVAIR